MMDFSDSSSDGVQSSNSSAISLAYMLVTVGTFALRIESAETCKASITLVKVLRSIFVLPSSMELICGREIPLNTIHTGATRG